MTRTWDGAIGITLKALAVLALVVALAGASPSRAAETGPTLEVGTPELRAGKVAVPINASGSGFSAFAGFQVHLRWDPAIFNLDSATSAGGAFDSTIGRGLCVGPITNGDADGGGMLFACASLGVDTNPTGPGVTTAGLIATIILAPVGTGCSALHLFTFGGADGGSTGSGSLTNSANASTPGDEQVNQYVDGSADTGGHACQPGGPPPTVPPGLTPTTPPDQSTVPVEIPTELPASAVTGTPPAAASPSNSTSVAISASDTAAARSATAAKSTTPTAGGTATGSQGTTKTDGGGSSKTPIVVAAVVAAVIVAAAGAGYVYFVRLRR